MLSMEQILALVIFIVMFVLIISDKVERHVVTLSAAALMIIVVFGICMQDGHAIMRALNVMRFAERSFWIASEAESTVSTGINWETIIFIAGMMIMVEGMGRAGFFKWLCMRIASFVKYRPIPLMISFMLMSFVLAMFIDSITVILFLAAVTVELAQLLKLDPIPMILSEIFCANLGGSATMCGDPPNIIIGTSLHYTFLDFITHTGVIALVGLVAVVAYFMLVYHKELMQEKVTEEDIQAMPSPQSVVRSQRDFWISTVIFLFAVVLLVTHAHTHLTVGCIGIIIAVITLFSVGKDARKLLQEVDYRTLLFFTGLFVVVSGLEETGVLNLLADFIKDVSGGRRLLMIAIILWVSAIASAIIDNIPFAATMIPVIRALSVSSGMDLSILAWALALGTDIGGSATPIGASANVVGTSVAIKNGYPITWGKYCRTSIPASILVIFIAMLLLFFVAL
jgi:Na+/H+ antiporter NhaD/arsenite permease-like protein